MSLAPTAIATPRVAGHRSSRVRDFGPRVVAGCYLLGALAVTWRLWSDPAGRAQTGDTPDVDLFAWFLRYSATAVAHGRLPALVTTAMNAPRGVNLMWNTSMLLPGLLLTPVTLLAGPQASLTVLLTAGFAGSAASLMRLLRRWGASLPAAALGGAVYGFSPALMNSGIGHYNLQFAVAPPLIIDALLRIVTGRGSALRTGAWLGLLTAAQLFTGEELLAETALASLVLVAVLAVSYPRAARELVPGAVTGLAAASAVTLLICGHALWVQFAGPLTERGSPWQTTRFASSPADFVTPAGNLLFHTAASAAAAARYPGQLSEYLAYLGWPFLAALVAAVLWFWPDQRVRAAAVTFVTLDLFSLGGSSRFLPSHWLRDVPVLGQVLPDRLSILAAGAAAATLAYSLDLACSAAPWLRSRPWRSLAIMTAALVILPLAPLPYQAAAVTPTPAGWQAVFTRLRVAPAAHVLVIPVPFQIHPQALRWQAETGAPGSLIGGYFIGPNQKTGHAAEDPAGPASTLARYLDALWAEGSPAPRPSEAQIRADLRYWRPAAVVAVTSPAAPLGRFLIGLFGPPSYRAGDVLAWRFPGPPPGATGGRA
jgi:hypothetical protein